MNKVLKGYKTIQFLKKQGYEFDLIHGFSTSPIMAINSYLAGKGTTQKRVIHTMKSQGKGLWARPLFARMLNLASMVTVPTSHVGKEYIKRGCRKVKLRVVRSNINRDRFKPRDRNTLKQKHGYEGKNVVLYYGAIRKEKGVDSLLEAIPHIRKQIPNVEFIFAIRSRATEKRDLYLQKAAQLQCDDVVKIIIDDVPIEEFVSMADTVVLAYPTLVGTEGNPSCLLEAMASKTPVVTTELPELQEIVAKDKDVLMATPGDSQSVAQEVVRILTNQELRQSVIENAYRKSAQFDVKVISSQFLRLYGGKQ